MFSPRAKSVMTYKEKGMGSLSYGQEEPVNTSKPKEPLSHWFKALEVIPNLRAKLDFLRLSFPTDTDFTLTVVDPHT